MPRWLRILLIVLVVVILLPVIGIAVFAAAFDADSLKPRIVAAVKQATGRDLAIGGKLHLSLALRPAVEADGVSFANMPGGSRPQMATIQRLQVQVALLPLLQRQVVIDSIVLDQPDILLETSAAGVPNWQMTPAAPAPAAAAAPAAPADAKAQGFGIAVRRVTITQGKVTYRDGRTGQAHTVDLPRFDLEEDGPQAPMLISGQAASGALTAGFNVHGAPLAGLPAVMLPSHVDLQGTLSGQPVGLTADLTGGRDGVAPVTVDIAGTAGAATLSVKGGLARPAALAGMDLVIAARIPDPAQLAAMTGQSIPVLGALGFDGKATGDARGEIAMHGFRLTTQAGDLSGDVTVGSAPVPSVRGTVTSGRLDVDALRAATGQPKAAPLAAPPAGAPPPAAAPPAPPPAAGNRLIPDTPLPLDALRAANADLQVTVGQLIDGGVTIGNIAFHLVLSGGKLTLDPLTAQLPGGPLQAGLSVDASQPAPAAAPVSLRLRAPGLAVQTLLAALRMPPVASGPVDVLADMRGAGRTPRAIAASLGGTLGLAMQNGQVDEAGIQKAFGGIIKSANLPGELAAGSGETAINCFATRLDFAGGRGTLRALLLDTARAHVEGDGTVNLADETLALNLRPLARLGSAGVAVPLRVTGTFEAPRGQVDTGAVAGALASGGGFKAVIGALSNAASSQACAPVLAVARGGAPPPPTPEAAPATPAPGGKAPKPADLLKQLFK